MPSLEKPVTGKFLTLTFPVYPLQWLHRLLFIPRVQINNRLFFLPLNLDIYLKSPKMLLGFNDFERYPRENIMKKFGVGAAEWAKGCKYEVLWEFSLIVSYVSKINTISFRAPPSPPPQYQPPSAPTQADVFR